MSVTELTLQPKTVHNNVPGEDSVTRKCQGENENEKCQGESEKCQGENGKCQGDNVQTKSVEELALQPETEGGFVLVMQDGKSQTDSVEELALQPKIGG